MDILNPKSLREQADQALRRGRDPKKLVISFAGLSLGLSVFVFFANLFLDSRMDATGGLGNFGDRAWLNTLQMALPLGERLVVMALELGFLAGMLRITRGLYADHQDLKVGFTRFWPLLRLVLLQSFVYCAVIFVCSQVGSLIFLLTPFSAPLIEAVEAVALSGGVLDDATYLKLYDLMTPLFLVCIGVSVLGIIPFLFRFRLSRYCLLDDPRAGALAALRTSGRLMRKRWWAMLKVDLSLWYYYLALVLVYVVMNLDLLLGLVGIELPFSGALASGLILAVTLAVQFLVQVTLRCRAEATYITAYDALREKPRDSGVVLGSIFNM